MAIESRKDILVFITARDTANMRVGVIGVAHYSSPDLLDLGSGVLPSSICCLHIVLVIVLGRIYENAIVHIVVPLVLVLPEYGRGTSHDDTAVSPWNQI
jgi:hypothetical protein